MVYVMGVHGCKYKTSFSRKFRVWMSWIDHACDHVLKHSSRPWPTQESPSRPLQQEKEEEKFAQGWSRPSITPVTITWTPITPVTRRKRGEILCRGRHTLASRPWPLLYTTITAVIKAVTAARILFLSSLFLHASDHFSWTWSQLWSFCSIMIMPVTIFTRHDHARDQCPVSSYVCFCFPNAFTSCYVL